MSDTTTTRKFKTPAEEGSITFVDLTKATSGDVLINGDTYTGTREFTSKKTGSTWSNFLFKSDEGEITSISAAGQLAYKLGPAGINVQVGQRLLITYGGKESIKGSGFKAHQFVVQTEDTDDIDGLV